MIVVSTLVSSNVYIVKKNLQNGVWGQKEIVGRRHVRKSVFCVDGYVVHGVDEFDILLRSGFGICFWVVGDYVGPYLHASQQHAPREKSSGVVMWPRVEGCPAQQHPSSHPFYVALDVARARPSSSGELEVETSGGKLVSTISFRHLVSFHTDGWHTDRGLPSFCGVAFP